MDRFVRILENEDWVVDYDKLNNKYRAAMFVNLNFVDEVWFDAYKEKACLVRCKDCALKHYSESGNLWCDIFDKIMPENGFCCFADDGK